MQREVMEKVSIPYRQAKNVTIPEDMKIYKTVSIPYRQAKNRNANKPDKVAYYSFNPLQVG